MSKLVSYDAILAALAVIAIGGGCAKKDEAPKATAESVTAAAPPAPIATTTAPAVEPGAVTDTTPAVAIAPAVDAGVEARKAESAQKNAAPPSAPPKPGAAQRKGSAACGAGTCGSDMKK